LIVGVLPSILAPKAYRGRAALQSAYGAYYLNKYDQEPDVSDLIRKRAETYRRHGIDPIEIGKREISVLQVATGNVIATMFFTLVFITADPVVTEFIRREILSAIVLSGGRNGWEEATLNISSLEELCPLLVSAYKETERIVVSQVSIRRVMRDTVISDGNLNYLLRAGADVQIPAGVSHLSKAVWGSDAAEFNFKRLLKSDAKGEATKELEKERKRAYFPFGGGKYLCPGRQYAFAQILALVAALIMGFDIRGEDGSSIQMPEIIRSRIAEATASPSDKGMRMGAKFIQRHNWENVQWKFI
jgi:cytochrome P450